MLRDIRLCILAGAGAGALNALMTFFWPAPAVPNPINGPVRVLPEISR